MAKKQAGMFGNFGMPNFGVPNPLANSALIDNPVMNTITGGMDFMKNLWGSASSASLESLTGFVAPTLDVEELDRKITDLKAVEGWLQANAAMLRATIQALEVQRNTIATLKSFTSLAAHDSSGDAPRFDFGSSGRASAAPVPDAMTTPRTSSGLPPGWPVPDADKSAAKSAAPRARKPAATAVAADKTSAVGGDVPKRSGAKRAAGKPVSVDNGLAVEAANASINNAAAWWSMLQDQFTKVAGAAVTAAAKDASGAKTNGAGRASGAAKNAAAPARKHPQRGKK